MTPKEFNENNLLASHSQELPCSPFAIYKHLSDVEGWLRTFSEVEKVSLDGPVLPGAGFNWTIGKKSMRGRLVAADRPLCFEWESRSLGTHLYYQWKISHEDELACYVEAAVYGKGLALRWLEKSFADQQQTLIENWIHRLKMRAGPSQVIS